MMTATIVFLADPDAKPIGTALKFYCHVRIQLRGGERSTARTVKNKIVAPFQEVEI